MDLLKNLDIDLDDIEEPTKTICCNLFNVIEKISTENQQLKEENQKLRDEIALLKGEQGKPVIKSGKKESTDISSETERGGGGKGGGKRGSNRGTKKNLIEIDREERCQVNKNDLPEDAVFKGYEDVIVQDIKVTTDNIKFRKEVYYSPSLKKTFRGQLPEGYHGEFGPNIKALTILMKHVCNTSEPKITEFMRNFNIIISSSTISNILIKDKEKFHKEKEDIYSAGLKSDSFQQIDDTGARVNGENWYTHVVCNFHYTAYFTKKRKNRLTILDIFRNFKDRVFCYNEETISLLVKMKVSKKILLVLQKLNRDKIFNEKEIEIFLQKYIPDIGKNQKSRVLEALAIAAYHTEQEVIDILLCDDAPQFKLLTKQLGLCWVHDGRHYKKINSVISYHQNLISNFLKKYWEYYNRLLEYKKSPCDILAAELSRDFDELFSTVTGYENLDNRIEKTKNKKKELLLVLEHPHIPLHNNASELGARAQVRKLDVSLQMRTEEGVKAVDTFLTIIETAKKLGVNIYDYIHDRISEKNSLPSLAELILQKTMEKI